MSVASLTCRRTLNQARALYPTALAVGGFLAVTSALFAFALQSAEGTRVALATVWVGSVAPVLPALAAFLAMDSWSDDLLTGRIESLLTAAVRERELVVGKFFGVFTLLAGAVAFSLAATLAALAALAPDALAGAPIVSFAPGLLGLLLQGALWTAFSVAVSAMTRHGAVAAATSVILLIGFPRAVWAGLMAWSPSGRAAYGEMPLDAHAVDLSAGVVSPAILFAYLLLTALALFVATHCVRARRLVGRGAARLRASTALTVALAAVFSGLAVLLALRLDRPFDLGVGARELSFSPRLKNTLLEVNGDISVTCVLSRGDARFRPVGHFLRALQREADATGGARIDVRYVDPRWDIGAARRLMRLGATDASLVFEKARRVVVVALKDGYGESLCVSAIRRVALPPQRRNVYWTSGHGEAAFDAYDTFGLSDIARELSREGYVNRRLDLTGDAQVPADSALVVVAGAKEDFSRVELGRIDAYLKRGGRLLALLSAEQGGVASLLPSWGLRALVQPLSDARTLSGSDVIVSDFTDHAICAQLGGAQIVLERPISFVPSAATEGGAGADRLEYSSVARVGASAVAAAVQRGAGAGIDLAIRPTRIVAVGDATFVMNGSLAARANANRDFFLNAVAYLAGADALAAGGEGTVALAAGLDRAGRMRFAAVTCGALPVATLLVLLAGVFLRRHRR